MILLICGIPSPPLQKYTNELMYKTKRDSQKEKHNLNLLGRGINSEFGISVYILLYINVYNHVQSIYKYR